MATTDTSTPTTYKLSTDIFSISEYVESIKKKYIDIPEDTLYLGVYGFLSNMFSNIIQNTAVMASEYSMEAIPTRAKFERNIIAHALSLGINKIFATPAEIDVVLSFPETALLENMTDGKFVLDKEYIYNIGDDQRYPYHIDYDIVIRRDKLPNGKYVYSAKYDIDNKNMASDITNPYLPALGVVNMDGDSLISLHTVIRQLNHSVIYKNITVTNPLENKVINFSFEDQLAYFYVEVVEGDTTHYLKPIYDGLYDYTSDQEFINYMFLDESNIRLTFNRDSYQPRSNAEVTIHVFTTLGEECNFKLSNYELVKPLTSERFTYNSMYVVLQTLSDSEYGTNKLSVEDLKQVIPREALSRGSVTTYTDLNNVFNSIQTDDCKLYFLERVHNQVERLYYSYILLKDGNNIVPTNTITAKVPRSTFDDISKYAFTIKPGTAFYLDPDTGSCTSIANPTEKEIQNYDRDGFLYMNPYLITVNKSPFYVAYYMTLMNYTKELFYEYTNEESVLQFITLSYHAQRDFYTDPETFKITITATQNIDTDFDMVTYADDGTISECKLSMYAVLYTTDANDKDVEMPVRFLKGELLDFDDSEYTYTFQLSIGMNDIISRTGTYMGTTSGLYAVKTGKETAMPLPPNLRMRVFYLAKMDTAPKGRFYGDKEKQNLDDLIPGLEKYTLTNVYGTGDTGVDFYYDYSDICNSYIELNPIDDSTVNFDFNIYKIPVVKYTYLNTEERFRKLFKLIDRRRRYIQSILLLLEDSFGVDYKYFNTYGPSLMYNIDNETNIDRINLSLTFEVKFQIASEKSYITAITNSIKEYIEDMNYITDLHMPNLITYITNLYRQQLVYIKFIGLNKYESLHQSIYKNPKIDADYFVETQTVPEFINVNTLDNNLPDITFKIVT